MSLENVPHPRAHRGTTVERDRDTATLPHSKLLGTRRVVLRDGGTAGKRKLAPGLGGGGEDSEVDEGRPQAGGLEEYRGRRRIHGTRGHSVPPSSRREGRKSGLEIRIGVTKNSATPELRV